MFLSYYGLAEQPFGVTPDARFLYMSRSHREALASLLYGIQSGRGFLALVASPGMGKTTLLFQFMGQLRESSRTVFLFQTQSSAADLLVNLIADLGLEPVRGDMNALQNQLNDVLIREAQIGKRLVVVIDEAQNMRDDILEFVRMLSNFETQSSKLIQIVLAGQPQLADKLAQAELTQLRQRVSVICRLDPLDAQEGSEYIDNRLKVAGYKGGSLFTPEARGLILQQSAGIPRDINNLCFHALSLGYAKRQKKIDLQIVQEVLDDLDLEPLGTQRNSEPAPQGFPETSREVPPEPKTRPNPPAYQDSYRWRRSHRSVVPADFYPRRKRIWGLGWAFALLFLLIAAGLAWPHSRNDIRGIFQAIHNSGRGTLQSASGQGSKTFSKPESQSDSQGQNSEDLEGSHPSRSAGTPGSPVAADSSPVVSGQAVPSATSSAQDPAPGPSQAGRAPSGPALRTGTLSGLVSQQFIPTKDSARLDPSRKVARSSHTNGRLRSSAHAGVGELFVQSNVRRARIYINGESGPDWVTPHAFYLREGTYWVSVRVPGSAPWSESVHVTKGETKWAVANVGGRSGVVVIETQLPRAPVYIDGKAYGPSPVVSMLLVGKHNYQVIPPNGAQPFSGSFVLKPSEILRIRVRWPGSGTSPSAGRDVGRLRPSGQSNSSKWGNP